MQATKIRFSASIVITVFALAGFVSQTFAFYGPSVAPGSGGGLFTVDANNNVGFGTASPTPINDFDSANASSSLKHGYIFTIASTTNPGVSIKNLSANGMTYIWSSKNDGTLQLYRESGTYQGKAIMTINQFGNVGVIGNADNYFYPTERFEVAGNIKASFGGTFMGSGVNLTSIDPIDFISGSTFASGNYAINGALGIGTATSTGLPSSGLYVAGNVGIGTTTPSYPLTVAENGGAGNAQFSIQRYNHASQTNSWNFTISNLVNSSNGSLLLRPGIAAAGFGISTALSNTPNFVINTSGNVGIGTSTPTYKLEVGGGGIFGLSRDAYQSAFMQLTNVGGIGNQALIFDANAYEFRVDSVMGKFVILNNGNVGIATTTPAYPLTVAGTIYSSTGGFRFPDGSTQTTAAAGGNLWTASSTAIYNANAGNVGIGTVNPVTKLEIQSASDPRARYRQTGHANYWETGISGGGSFVIRDASNAFDAITIAPGGGYTQKNTAGNVLISNPNASPNLHLVTVGGGVVGIGTASPVVTARLTVSPTSSVSADMGTGRIQNLGAPINATDASTKSYVDSVVGGGSGSTVGYWTLSGSNLYASSTAYDVGIGTATPDVKLSVMEAEGVRAIGATLTPSALAGLYLSTNSLELRRSNTSNFGLTISTAVISGAFGATGGYIAFSPSSTEAMRIDNAGNVGIGTTTPVTTAHLTVAPISGVSADMNTGRIQNLGAPVSATDAATRSYVDSSVTTGINGTPNYVPKFATANTIGDSLIYDNGTNVGIGTTTPGVKLEVIGQGRDEGRHSVNSISTMAPSLYLRSATAVPSGNTFGVMFTSMSGGVAIQGNTTNVDANTYIPHLLITNGGNVGVGVTALSSKFQVGGDILVAGGTNPNGDGSVGVIRGDNVNQGTGGAVQISNSNTASNQYIAFGTTPSGASGLATFTEKMRILSNGNVGIGTSTPMKRLTVNLSDAAGADEFLVNDSANAQVFSVDSDGNVIFAAYPATVNFNNSQTINFNAIGISDPGPGEGLYWSGTSAGWAFDVSPLDRVTNGDGNLNIYGTANNIAMWRPLLFINTSSTYTTATQSATALNFTSTGSGNITFNPGGSVGVGTTTPAVTAELTVGSLSGIASNMGTGRIINLGTPIAATDAATRGYVDSVSTGASGVWLLSGSNLYASSTTWKVGVGTVSPVSRLHSYDFSSDGTAPGRTTIIDALTLETANTAAQPYNGFGQGIAFRGRTYSNGTVRTLGRIATVLTDDSVTNTGSAIIFQTVPDSTSTSTPTEKMRISYDGTIGFGTSVPTSTARITVNPISAVSADMATGRIQRLGTPLVATDAATRGYVDSSVAGGSGAAVGYWTLVGSNLYNSSGSNVGVGTSTPNRKLQVFGDFGSDSGNFYTDNLGNLNAVSFYDKNNQLYFLDPSAAASLKTAGNVVIGGSGAAGAMLDVIGNGFNSRFKSNDASTGGYSETHWENNTGLTTTLGSIGSGYTNIDWAGSGYLYTNQSHLYIKNSNASGDISFFTGGIVNPTNIRMTIGSNGYVGIGTTTPASVLHVNGAVTFGGSLNMLTNNISMNGGNIGNVGKLTVTAIDPLYSIDGAKYATYAASIAGGVKEEYVGKGKLISNSKFQI
ncbi:MAG: hypothetical protein WCV80_03355, partial [Candidatus Paceibacterota bacterium]